MTNTTPLYNELPNWNFGKYRDDVEQKAYLGIQFMIGGNICKKPLILPLSDHSHPSRVMTALVDAGADINPIQDIKILEHRLKLENLLTGKYAGKLGWFEDSFLTPSAFYGVTNSDVVIQPKILDAAEGHFDQKGDFESWKAEVAVPAQKSSFLMFGIMMALASILQKRVFGANEEGFIINLFGATSRGKTTALATAKSFSGDPEKLLRWDLSSRYLTEAAAAASDTLLAIDDLDSIADKSGFRRYIAEWTHLLASGRSRSYSMNVRDQLPDLSWTCCALTCGKGSVEELSLYSGHSRSPSDKVRLMDIPIPPADKGGIWDNMQAGDDSGKLTQMIREAVTRNHGSALVVWLKKCVGNPAMIEDAKSLIDYYIEKLGIEPSAGMEHRIAKKFGLVFAAGILGQEQEMLPWGRERIYDVVQTMHRLSLRIAYDSQHKMDDGLEKLYALYTDEDRCPMFEGGKRPNFRTQKEASCFIVEKDERQFFYIRTAHFDGLFVDKMIAENAIETLKHKNVFMRSGKKTTVQARVRIGNKTSKVRYLKLDVEKFTADYAQSD